PFLVSAALSPDGRSIATLETARFTGGAFTRVLTVRDAATGKETFHQTISGGESIDFDGRRVVVSSPWTSTAYPAGVVIDIQTGDEVDLPSAGYAPFAPDRVRARTTSTARATDPSAAAFAGTWTNHVGKIEIDGSGSVVISWFVNDPLASRSGDVQIS